MNSDTAGDNTMSQEMENLEDRLDAALLRLGRVEQANDESGFTIDSGPALVGWRGSDRGGREFSRTIAGAVGRGLRRFG